MTDGAVRREPGRWHRVAVGAGAGAATVALVAVTLGLLTGRLIGTEDNGDGHRLFCGVGLVPRTADAAALWKGGVVSDFAVGPPTCGMWMPSSAGLLLRMAALGHRTLTLGAVAWWYAVLLGLAVGLAAWAATATRLWRAAVVAVPVVPLALPAFSRLFASTYAEPAGLVGTVTVACGLAALAVAGRDRRLARRVAVGVVVAGGMLAATAKVAYLPVLAAAVLVVVLALALRLVVVGRRVVGVVVAGLVVAVVAVPVAGSMHYQQQIYEGANVHDVVFTMALTELGPRGTADLDLPPEADAIAGDGYFNGPPLPTAPWWLQAIRERPASLRTEAVMALVRRPPVLLRAIGVGLQATTRADLPYLASAPADPGRLSAPAGDPGWSGSHEPDLRGVLDATHRPPWLPSALVLAALAAAASTPVWRRRAPAAARWCWAAGLGAVTALGLVATALAGDGYFEVFKHVWLAAYVLVVTGSCLVAALVSAVVGPVVGPVVGAATRSRDRRPSTPAPDVSREDPLPAPALR